MLLGIDIGGTAVKLGIVDEAFHVVEHTSIPTHAHRSIDVILGDIICAAKPLCGVYHPRTIGVGSPGRVDPEQGIVRRAGHLPFCNTPVVSIIRDALGLPTFIDNDANCAMLAEYKAGACADCRDALMVTIGTGIGGAILIDGKVVRGHNFRAGELGHFIVDMHGKPCPCGLHGCFEQYASAAALCKQAAAAVAQTPNSLLAHLSDGNVTGKTLFAAAEKACPVAVNVLTTYGEYMAMGLNSFVKIFMPQCIVLAGGITNAGDALLSYITPHLLPEADVRLSDLDGNAGVLGAALLGYS